MPTADAHWRASNTLPAVLITLDLGTDPETGTPRTLDPTDTVTQIMRDEAGVGAAIVRTLPIVDAAANTVRYKPSVGDLDTPDTYKVMFDRTTAGGDVESIPDDEANDYTYIVTARRDA